MATASQVPVQTKQEDVIDTHLTNQSSSPLFVDETKGQLRHLFASPVDPTPAIQNAIAQYSSLVVSKDETPSTSYDVQQSIPVRKKYNVLTGIGPGISTMAYPIFLSLSIRAGMRAPIEGYAPFKIISLFLIPGILFFLSHYFLTPLLVRIVANGFDSPATRMRANIQYFLYGVFTGLGAHWTDTLLGGATSGVLYWVAGGIVGGLAGASAGAVVTWFQQRTS